MRSMTFLLAAAALAIPAMVAAQPAEQVFLNGAVYTADAKDRVVTAFALSGDHFVAVGSDKQVKAYIGPETKVVDLHGRFVSPGLTDAHFHNEGGGSGIDLSQVRTMDELLAVVETAAKVAASGDVVLSNADWHEAQLSERRLPTRVDLDRVAPDVPVILARGGHTLILNSAALQKYGISEATAVPTGGTMGRDASGRLTGALDDAAMGLVHLPPAPPVSLTDLMRTQSVLNRYGITAVRIPGFYRGDLLSAYHLMQEAGRDGKLSLRYVVYLPGFALRSREDARKLVDKWNVRQDEGDDWVRIGGIKLGVDGGFEGANMTAPYAEPFGRGGSFHGTMTISPENFRDVVEALDDMGWRPAVHAVGDAGVAEVLDGFEAANARNPIAGKRWTIEHAFIASPALLDRMRKLGIQLSVQDHLYLVAPILKRYWGSERAAEVTPLKSYLDTGLVVVGGTDAPVIAFNPFLELYHFASRDTMTDGVYGPDQMIRSRAALLRVVTINYARLIGEDKRKGSIEIGKLADFAVLSDNFLTTDVRRIPEMHALATFVGGREAYRDAAFPGDTE